MRRDRLAPVLAVLGGAIVLVVALVVANQIGDHSNKPSASNPNVDSVAEMLSGIPQKGIELGNPNAKLTLVEFSDPQCPWCGEWARTVFPSLAQNYVRSGKLRIEYRGLAFLDDYPNVDPKDSDRLLALAQAAGLQNKLWNVVELEFDNQGTENTGYATDALLRGLVKAVDGLDADKAFSAAAEAIPLENVKSTSKVANTNNVIMQKIKEAQKLALTRVGERIQTPTFLLGRTGSKKTETIVGAQSLDTFTKAIDAQLKK